MDPIATIVAHLRNVIDTDESRDIAHELEGVAERLADLGLQVTAPATMIVVLTWSEVMAKRTRSRSANNGPWKTDTTAMALKTAVRQLWKWIPKSIEMQRAASLDAVDDMQVRVTQAAAWDPEITAALEGAGLAIETEAEHVALPAAASPAAAFNREAPARARGREPGEDPIESFLEREDERGGR